MEVHVAASGPRGCEAAGRVATDLILGTGLDAAALRTLSARARAARTAAGITTPLRIWAFVSTFVAPDRAAADAAWITQRGRSVGTARFSFASTFEDKGVPEAWQPVLRERLARYDFTNHGVGAGNTNGHLFDDHPDIQEYLMRWFQLLGTANECAARLRQVAEDAGLDGCCCALPAMTPDEDVIHRVRSTGEALQSLFGW
jgi:alkanesulfonate monooxygenase SsuD/methylene tetrahydromethanopterin reductase-like flavin-dependent oxidoreductase (luciferase family)